MDRFLILLFIFFNTLVACTQEKLIEYHENGSIKYEVPIVDSKKNGTAIKYNSKGKVVQKSTWVNGNKNGVTSVYYDNGNLKQEVNFVDGLQEGKMIEYDSLGRKTYESFFKKDVIEGEATGFYPNGKVSQKLSFVGGVLDGEAKKFYLNGLLENHNYYMDGKLIYIKHFTKDGEVDECYLPIVAEKRDSKRIDIELQYSTFAKPKIGVMLGFFDSKSEFLIDTLQATQIEGLQMSIELCDKCDFPVQGLLYEINAETNKYDCYQLFVIPN